MWRYGIKLATLVVFGVMCYGDASYSAVKNIIGASVTGPISNNPLTVTILCQAPTVCSRTAVPDWSNGNIFYGTDGSNCRKSINGGTTWANCGSNPSTTTVMNDYAVTMNGTVLALGNDAGGTTFRVKRSTNGATSWSTVYDNTPVDVLTTFPTNGRLRCARYANLCTFIGRDSTNTAWSLISTDDGATWTFATVGTNINGWMPTYLNSDGGVGVASVSVGDGLSNYRGYTFNGSLWVRSLIVWPTTSGGVCNWAFVMDGNPRTICHNGSTGTSYTLRDKDGNVLTTFSLPDVPSDNGSSGVGQAISVRSNAIWLVRGTTAGKTGIWVSLDGAVSFTELFTTDPAGQGIGNQGSIYEGVDGCIYIAYITSVSTSTVLKVC